MKGMKMLKVAMALLAVSALTAQCSLLGLEDEEEDNTALLALALLAGGTNSCTTYCPNASDFVAKSGNISASETWSRCTVLTGVVNIQSGATVTVPAGSCVQGQSGSALFVLQGAQLNAVGTSGAPIIFTSSRAEGQRSPQDWGGIVLIGNAPSSDTGQTTEGPVAINYSGGANAADSSGTLKYVRIEFCGNEVSPGDELNCLSMYAVGSGTTLEHIQAHMGKDDGFEWFGGRANASFLLATGIGDDAFDLDRGYRATITSAIDYRYPAASGVTYSGDPRGLEWDGSGSDDADRSEVTLNKFTLIGDSATQRAGQIREGAQATLTNGVYVGYPLGLNVDGAAPGTAAMTCTNVRGDQATTASNAGTNNCTLTSSSESISTYVTTAWDINNPSVAPNLPVIANAGTEGAWFTGWTYWVNK